MDVAIAVRKWGFPAILYGDGGGRNPAVVGTRPAPLISPKKKNADAARKP